MIINLSDIMSGKDSIKQITTSLEMEHFHLDGVDYEFAKKDAVECTITILGDRKVLLESKTCLSLLIPCSRCLEDVEISFDIEISRELDFNESDSDRIKELDEQNYIDGYNLDVDLLIFDEILLGFVGSFNYQKNIGFLLEILQECVRENKKYTQKTLAFLIYL